MCVCFFAGWWRVVSRSPGRRFRSAAGRGLGVDGVSGEAHNVGMHAGRFLLATIDGGGTIPPELGLAARLVRGGHRVRVLADPTVQNAARTAGCAFTSWKTAPHFATVDEQTALAREVER